MDTNEHELEQAARDVIGAAFEVLNELGPRFLEKVYENALTCELARRGYSVEQLCKFAVRYKGEVVGCYLADLVVNGCLLVELKCADAIAPEHLAQCINYLKGTGLRLALILNFKKAKLEFKRVIYG